MPRTLVTLAWIAVWALALSVRPAAAQPLHLILPTSNDALLRDDGPAFFQYTDRYFKGRRSRPWQGGQYGFVRNAKETSQGIIYTKFHEGMDIKPVYRDRRGEPLDTVRAIDDGVVVYVNNVVRHSNYGRYVVVEHTWSGAPFYSLYAHLNAVHVRRGQRVRQGERLGRLGYTGRGINRRRAHLHFEVNMLLNKTFQAWYDTYYRDTNYHGIYNGMNLAGIDVADLYLALRDEPNLTIEEFLKRQPAFYQVAVPNEGTLDLLWRYPWLAPTLQASAVYSRDVRDVKSWDISLTRTGLPVRIEPSSRPVSASEVASIERSQLPYSYLTNGIVSGSGAEYALSRRGQRHLELVTLTYDITQRRVSW